jgi:hypothetical protein
MTDVLTAGDIEHFVSKGYVRVRECFTPAAAAEYSQHIWTRLGYAPDDPSTWERDAIHMASHHDIDASVFAPRAWRAACQLVGGAERISTAETSQWTDGFIVNLSQGADQPWAPASSASPGWHIDGSWFRHFLDSPEQGLLFVVLWSEVVHRGGPTVAATDSIGPVARYLAAHPEGLLPGTIPYMEIAEESSEFVEATGEIGDVYLLHPFVLHTRSQNALRRPRFITNATLRLAEPMRFDRPDPAEHSPVERAVLRALGVDSLPFTPTAPRERVVSPQSKEHEQMIVDERERMAAAGHSYGA